MSRVKRHQKNNLCVALISLRNYLIYVIYSLLAKHSDSFLGHSTKTKHTTSILLFPLAIESHNTCSGRSCRQGRQWRRHWRRHLLSTFQNLVSQKTPLVAGKLMLNASPMNLNSVEFSLMPSWALVDGVFLLKSPVPWSFGRGGSWQIKRRQPGHDYGTMERENHAQIKCISASIYSSSQN